MPTPFSISAFPVRGYSIAEEVVGVKYLDAIPFGSRGQAFKCLGRLQLQICTVRVTGCNPHPSRYRAVIVHPSTSSMDVAGIEGEARCEPAKRV